MLRLLPTVYCLLFLAGCGTPAGIVFPPTNVAPWPRQTEGMPAETARIAYVGELSRDVDLKPARSMGQVWGEAFFGKNPPQGMATPYALCTDGGDRLFVADTASRLVHVFNMNTREYQRWRPGDKNSVFGEPVAVAWDPAGRLLVADSAAGVILAFDSSGKPAGMIGKGELSRPCGIVVEPNTRRIFVADVTAHQVVIFAPDGKYEARFGKRGTGLGQFNYPTFLAMDRQGQLYVSDSLNFRVQVFAPDLHPVRQIGKQGDYLGYFSAPKGLALDSEGHLYAVDAQFETVQIFDSEGRLLMNFGQEGTRAGEFWLPSGIFIDSRDRIWVADPYNRRVQVLDYLKAAP